MPTDSPAATTSLLMIAWNKYKESEDFINTKKWASHSEHVDSSLWAAFMNGYNSRQESVPQETPEVEGDVGELVVSLRKWGSAHLNHGPWAITMMDAANTIEALSAKNERLLKGFDNSSSLNIKFAQENIDLEKALAQAEARVEELRSKYEPAIDEYGVDRG